MNKRFSPLACAILALALVLTVGMGSFLGPCVHADGSFGACHWAGRALLGVGVLLAAEALAALLIADHGTRLGLYLALALTAVLGMLVPGVVVDLCRMATMRCQAIMKPGAWVLCGGMAALAMAGLILEKKKGGKSHGRE